MVPAVTPVRARIMTTRMMMFLVRIRSFLMSSGRSLQRRGAPGKLARQERGLLRQDTRGSWSGFRPVLVQGEAPCRLPRRFATHSLVDDDSRGGEPAAACGGL